MLNKSTVQICVPVCEQTVQAMKHAALLATQEGEFVEVRCDCLDAAELQAAIKEIDSWVSNLGRPVILTLRPEGQGGPRALDQTLRLEFLSHSKTADFIDIELDLALSAEAQDALDWRRVICSYHDFTGVPENLDKLYEQLAALPAAVLKITLQANDPTDCIPIFQLLDRARSDGRAIIAIGMGSAGIATRILGPSRGAFLTYAPIENRNATAPGQLTTAELRNVYRIDKIDLESSITGLLGTPVAHSISPIIHNAAFAAAGLNGVYIPFDVRDLKAFMKRMVQPTTREMNWNLRGLSVTAPYKSNVMQFLSHIEPAAREIGAVNTIVVEPGGLHGYNTDAYALIQPMVDKLGRLRHLRCAIIGAGGAARAALWSLRREQAEVTVFARNDVEARPVAEMFDASYRKLAEASFNEFDVVINTTPLGTRGSLADKTAAVAAQLRGAHLVYDLVYNPTETRFLREAREAGCETLGGSAMLVAQAAKQFALWTGQEAPLEVMQQAAEGALKSEYGL